MHQCVLKRREEVKKNTGRHLFFFADNFVKYRKKENGMRHFKIPILKCGRALSVFCFVACILIIQASSLVNRNSEKIYFEELLAQSTLSSTKLESTRSIETLVLKRQQR